MVATNDVTGEIIEFSAGRLRSRPINKAAKFVGASLAHVARCLVKDKKYKGKGYTATFSMYIYVYIYNENYCKNICINITGRCIFNTPICNRKSII